MLPIAIYGMFVTAITALKVEATLLCLVSVMNDKITTTDSNLLII